MDSLGDSYYAVAVLLVDGIHIGQEFVHVEIHLRKVHQVGGATHHTGQGGCTGKPARVTAHDLNHSDHAGIVYPAILVHLSARGGNILGGGGKARAVVGAEQVIVNGLGDAHNPALIARLGHEAADLGTGIHRVVAAIIEEIANIILLENLSLIHI